MSNFEQQPRFEFPWNRDEQGEYLKIRISDDKTIELREDTTLMYLFPDQPEADHLFVYTHMEDDQYYGFRIWRQLFDDILGEGAFSSLCDELFDKGFDCADDEEPSPLDIQAWEQTFNREYIKPNPIDKIVELAMANFDDAWKYYSSEWQ